MKRLRSRRAALVASLAAAARGRIGARRERRHRAHRVGRRSSSTTRSRSRRPTRGGRSIPTASLVDRAIYDTLFTYKGGDLAHPIPLLVSSFKASANAQDVHVPAEAERPLRRRHAADLGRRRLLAAAARQPEGQPGVPARGRHGLGAGQVHGRRSVRRRPTPQLPVILANPSTGHPQLGAREEERRHATPPTRRRPTRPRTGSTRPRSVGAGSGPYTLSAVQHDLAGHARRRTRSTGAPKKPRVVERRRPQHGRRRRSCSTSAAARTRSPSTSRPTRRGR